MLYTLTVSPSFVIEHWIQSQYGDGRFIQIDINHNLKATSPSGASAQVRVDSSRLPRVRVCGGARGLVPPFPRSRRRRKFQRRLPESTSTRIFPRLATLRPVVVYMHPYVWGLFTLAFRLSTRWVGLMRIDLPRGEGRDGTDELGSFSDA